MPRTARKPDVTEVVQYLNAARSALGFRGRPLSKVPAGRRLSNIDNPLSLALNNTPIDGVYAYLNGPVAQKVADAWGRRASRLDNNDREVPLDEQMWVVPLPDELARFLKAVDNESLLEDKAANGA